MKNRASSHYNEEREMSEAQFCTNHCPYPLYCVDTKNGCKTMHMAVDSVKKSGKKVGAKR